MSDPTIQSDQGQGEGNQAYDAHAAMAAMRAYNLDPTSDDAIAYARAWLEDSSRNDPDNRNRYSRAAQLAASQKAQAEAMQRIGDFDPMLVNDPGTLWQIANYKAAPPHTEQAKTPVSDISSITDPGELFRIAKERGLI